MKSLPLLVVLVFSVFQLIAVADSSVGKGMIVRLNRNLDSQGVLKALAPQGAVKAEVLIASMGLYRVEFKKNLGPSALLGSLNRNAVVRYAQPNHKVQLRQVANDAKFIEQWSLNGRSSTGDTSVTRAWDIGTGGKDKLGNDIVVAVVDGGIDITHSDLVPNLFTFKDEIPGNGIDDDGNGYVDDVHGWDALEESGSLPTNSYEIYHGTHVAGIVGAKGNNGQHTTGINWDVKILTVVGSTGDTARVAKAYGYVIAQKKLYRQTHGKKGANVVVTNSSFGVDFAKCDDAEYVLWNDLYNAMGEEGILSAVATANQDIDVDEVGDVPSGCTSPYILSVTNSNSNDELESRSAYGAKMVDLAAPGTEIPSTVPGNMVASDTGTSMATPHVAGAVGLLYNGASKKFAEYSVTEPAKAALALKDILLQSVDALPAFKDKCVTGGRLNIFKAMDTVSKY